MATTLSRASNDDVYDLVIDVAAGQPTLDPTVIQVVPLTSTLALRGATIAVIIDLP